MLQHQQRIGSDRRVHQRLEDLRASLVELSGDNSGIVLNISEGGMAILSTEDLDVDTLQNLRFQAPEFEHWIEIAAEIAWISDSRKQAGIRFKGLSETARIQLRAGISIATVRARRADQATKAGTTTDSRDEVTDSAPTSFETADSPTFVVSESTQVSNEVNTNPLVEKIGEDENLSHSDVHEAAPDSRLSEAHTEIETNEKVISSEASNQDAPAQAVPALPLNSADTNPQKTSALAPLNSRPSPLTSPQNALAEMRLRNLFTNSGVKQSGDVHKRISNRSDISYGKWLAVGAIAILASLLAFLVGWFAGDPSVMKSGH
jgi:hypothetical protein